MNVPPQEPPTSGRRAWLALALILLATTAVFARGLAGELVYDDLLLIGRNPLITDLANLPRLFSSGYWDFLDVREAQYIGYWRPLTAIAQALVWPFAGARPAPYHALCLAIHLGAVTAAFLVARRLSASAWIAGATALLFALHPAQVESVAWISALNDPLFGCLALFSIERFLAWRARGSRGLPVAALICFALALLAKELAAALLPLLFLLDLLRPRAAGEPDLRLEAPARWPAWIRRVAGGFSMPASALRAYLPFVLLFALYMGARMLVFASPWAGFERITTNFVVGALRLALLRIELFGGALEILTLPLELNLFRPFRPHIEPFDGALVRAAVFSAVYAALLVASLLGRRRLSLAALVIIPAGLLPPLLKVQSLGAFPLSERFLYLPVFGFALAVALLLQRALPRRRATLALLLLAGLYAARSHARLGFWKDEETLFRTAAAQSPRSIYVQWGLGRVLLERMNSTRDPRYLLEAEAVYRRAEELLLEAKHEPTDLMATARDYLQVNLGNAWCSIHAHDYSAAILVLEELVRRLEQIQEEERAARAKGIPVIEQFLDLAQVYTALGVAQHKSGQLPEAEASFRRSLELQPSAPETHQNLGRMYAEQGRWPEAVGAFEAAARLRPGNAEDRLLLAQALETLGQSERASELARALVSELPARAEPLVVLAAGALRREDPAGALNWIAQALERDPRNALAWYHKARAQLQRGAPGEAMIAFRNAVELDPNSFEAHYDCAAFLLSQGAVAEARPYLLRAYALAPATHRALLRATLAQAAQEAAPVTAGEQVEELRALTEADSTRGELEQALEWLEQLLRLAPEDAPAAYQRARLLRRLRRNEEAAAALRACAERAPTSFELWSELASLLDSMGRQEEARAASARALQLEPPAGMPEELLESMQKRLRELLEKAPAPDGPPAESR